VESTVPTRAEAAATSTFSPTLVPEEILVSNGDCRLPCWWGIVPGETAWVSAEAYLAPYSLEIAPYEREEYTYYTAYLIVPEYVSERPVTNDFAVWDDTVQLLSVHGQTGADFTPATILAGYGMPDQVWVQTGRLPREGFLGFSTALLYQQQGFLLFYGTMGQIEGEYVSTCISNTDTPLRLLTWDADLDLSYAEAMAIGMSTTLLTYDIDLETATGISVKEFYDNFSVTGSEVCLRTPRNLWPNP
jgi:hypothetical protein